MDHATSRMNVIVIGGGSFGTAIACAIAQSTAEVTLLVRSREQEESINLHRRNTKYLPDYKLPKRVKAATRRECLKKADVIFLALPAHAIEATSHSIAPLLKRSAIVINLAKGLHEKRFTLDKAMARELGNRPIGTMKGPTFARPMLQGAPSGMTLALNEPARTKDIHQLFRNSAVVIEDWHDMSAVEFIGATKNVLAIIMGISDATEDNPNTRFLVIQKILREAHLLLETFRFHPGVLYTFAGCGDLLMTSLCDSSRNRTLGLLIGRGFEFARSASGPVLEGRRTIGIITARLRKERQQHPLLFSLEAVFRNELSPQEFFKQITRN
jgi:glycerol-3-phosphate dehydrogenase (NAD(P)+)